MAKLAHKVPEIDIPRLKYTDPAYFTFVSKFKEVVFLVEADSFADLSLWCRHFHDADAPRRVKSWENDNPGYCTVVGTCDRRPVNLSMSYNMINGHRVLFYHAVSQVVDHELVDKFLKINFPDVGRCDAMNFHQCIQHIETLKVKR
jgi:hypothetical protein